MEEFVPGSEDQEGRHQSTIGADSPIEHSKRPVKARDELLNLCGEAPNNENDQRYKRGIEQDARDGVVVPGPEVFAGFHTDSSSKI